MLCNYLQGALEWKMSRLKDVDGSYEHWALHCSSEGDSNMDQIEVFDRVVSPVCLYSRNGILASEL